MIRRPIESFQRYLLDRMVLRPSRQHIAFVPQQRVMLQDGADRIECFVQSNFDDGELAPDLVVLKFPGTAGRAERSSTFPMSMLVPLRISMWTWNPPGYGRSEGRASLPRIALASIEFWRQVTEQYSNQPSVWLCGNSLGCATALHVAATVDPVPNRHGLILRNPPPLKPVVKRAARQYPLGGWMGPVVESLCESMNAMSTARRCRLPAVFLQSQLDSLVPLPYQNRLIRAYGGPKRAVVLHGLEHSDIATEVHQPEIEASIRWLRQQCVEDTD